MQWTSLTLKIPVEAWVFGGVRGEALPRRQGVAHPHLLASGEMVQVVLSPAAMQSQFRFHGRTMFCTRTLYCAVLNGKVAGNNTIATNLSATYFKESSNAGFRRIAHFI